MNCFPYLVPGLERRCQYVPARHDPVLPEAVAHHILERSAPVWLKKIDGATFQEKGTIQRDASDAVSS